MGSSSAFSELHQKGLLFVKPPSFNENQLLHFLTKLQETLSLTLVHFYPLSGRLSTATASANELLQEHNNLVCPAQLLHQTPFEFKREVGGNYRLLFSITTYQSPNSNFVTHQAVNNHTVKEAREFVDLWVQNPFIVQMGRLFDPCSVMMGSSPRQSDGSRSGYADKFDGKVSLKSPGFEGGNSMILKFGSHQI
ncbi:hypothetical protein Leryth_003914 [Lithospermum erythrorhizon]|nr:hypothetical protein Leryth_003914 [Lithospermum erythrorhizon]